MSETRPSHRPIARAGATFSLALSAALLVACSGGSDPSSTPDPSSASGTSTGTAAPSSSGPGAAESAPEAPSASVLQATETDFAIELSQQEVEAGTLTVEVTNDGSATHDLVIEDASGTDIAATEVLPPGGTGTVEVDLEPGEYVVYCSIGDHRGRGMELALTVG